MMRLHGMSSGMVRTEMGCDGMWGPARDGCTMGCKFRPCPLIFFLLLSQGKYRCAGLTHLIFIDCPTFAWHIISYN